VLERLNKPYKVTWGCADSLDEEGQPGVGRGIPVFQPGDPVRHCPGLNSCARCFKPIWKIGKVGKVGKVGKLVREGREGR
jgi:hypothetical protein